MYNATRFAQKPLPQPSYSFSDVPRPARDLKGSTLQRINDREHFQTCMAEMLLLCKEAIRRQPHAKGTGSKPLSLEYLADRLDVDDPCWGYLVRSETGMLQGFVTVTTFTTYQKTFRWDSDNDNAFSYDDEDDERDRLTGARKWDEGGALASAMQATVRCGDVWNEGIVWPRIAEISLLGGLGCGRILVSLVVEDLERMKASGTCNYDFVALQATDNSIPFYESMGFIRVGAVVKKLVEDDATNDECSSEAESVQQAALNSEIVTSGLFSYPTKKAGETPNDVAKKFEVEVWDIVFLNKDIYKDICPTSRLMASTVLRVPIKPPTKPIKRKPSKRADLPKWYVAKENETPRTISRKFGINCLKFVEANKARLQGLVSNSRLKEGTRVKVSHFDVIEEEFQPYGHWGFPDDKFEESEPSYMMALRLDRKRGAAGRSRPVLESLAVPISEYEPTPLLFAPSPPRKLIKSKLDSLVSATKKGQAHPDEPQPPKRPPSAYIIFAKQQRERMHRKLERMTLAESSKVLADIWSNLSEKAKGRYEDAAAHAKKLYLREKESYQKELDAYLASKSMSIYSDDSRCEPSTITGISTESLFNKVVRLRPGAFTEGSDYTYWYVLTFIPDLRWCHLAPLVQVGVFDEDKPKSKGRPKWMLVDEKLGKEVDISASFCIPIKAKVMKKTLDADREEWDIVDEGICPTDNLSVTHRMLSSTAVVSDESFTESDTGTYPGSFLRNKKRKYEALQSHELQAIMPGTNRNITIRISSECLEDTERKAKRGRPRKDNLLHPDPKVVPNRNISKDLRLKINYKSSIDNETSPTINEKFASAEKRGRGRPRKNAIRSPAIVACKQGGKGNPAPKMESFESLTDSSGILCSDSNRPKRAAAPSYLGESPAPAAKRRNIDSETITVTDRPTRSATHSSFGTISPKRRAFVLKKSPLISRRKQLTVNESPTNISPSLATVRVSPRRVVTTPSSVESPQFLDSSSALIPKTTPRREPHRGKQPQSILRVSPRFINKKSRRSVAFTKGAKLRSLV